MSLYVGHSGKWGHKIHLNESIMNQSNILIPILTLNCVFTDGSSR